MSNMRLGMCATVRPLCAEDPVRLLSKSKYALGMRQTLFSPRIRMTLASMRLGYAQGLKPSAAFAVAPLLLRENEVCAQVCAEPEATMGCLGQSSFETGYALGMCQPHSSLVIWIQLVIWYALGMRQVCEDCFPEIETVSQVCALNPDSA